MTGTRRSPATAGRLTRLLLRTWFFFLLTAVLLLFTWPRSLLLNRESRLREAETRHRQLLDENQRLETRLLWLRNADQLRRRLAHFQIELVEPESWNIHYLEAAAE